MQIQAVHQPKVRKDLFINVSKKSNSEAKAENIKEDYEYVRKLGEGIFEVFEAIHKGTKEHRAIKAISKQNVQDKKTLANDIEIMLLRKLVLATAIQDHPNIIKLYEVYENEKTIYLVQEKCQGGQLFELISRKKFLTQEQTSIIMRQLLSAIAYMHDNNVCHRDLKPENILLKNKEDIGMIKIIDFGISKVFRQNELENQPRGTVMYMAPEIISGNYGKEVDNWACGVILYVLLCGRLPFYGKDVYATLKSIKHGVYNLELEPFKHCNPHALDLMSKLLERDPKKRWTAKKAYSHPWIQNLNMAMKVNFTDEVFRGLKKLVNMKGLKRTILMYLTLQIPEKDVENLLEIFRTIDKDGNGMISREEMRQGLSYFGQKTNQKKIEEKDMDEIFDAMDFDGSGQVDYSGIYLVYAEFLASFLDCFVYKNEKFLREAFNKMDVNKDNKLGKSDLQNLIHSGNLSFRDEMSRLIDEVDLDQDGKIDFNEFMGLLRQKTMSMSKTLKPQ